jgi:phosphomannomutase
MVYETLTNSQKLDLNTSMFKAYDIRTKSTALTEGLANRLIHAVGWYLSEVLQVSKVVLGRDARLAAPALMESAIEIFSQAGLQVILNPLQVSTCQFYFSCMQHPDAAGIMFTASHNPGVYIGLKLMGPGLQTLAMGTGPQGGITCIRELYCEGKTCRGQNHKRGSVLIRRYLDQYIDYSLQLAGIDSHTLEGSSILTDFLCGAAGTEVTEALEAAGAHVRVRNLVPDGKFPAGDPNPIIAESIKPTCELMRREQFDYGFCYDGDGDRLDVMNSEGTQLTPSFNLSILIPEIKSFYKGVYDKGFFGSNPWSPHMYYDVKANPLSVVQQASCGIGVHIIRNGHSFIKESLRRNLKNQYLVASEESAHYYMNFPLDLKDYSAGFAATENTLYFSLLTAKMWSRNPKLYEQAMQTQNSIYRKREWPCHFHSDEHLIPVVDKVESVFRLQGLDIFKKMEDGNDLDATLMRSGLPEEIDEQTNLAGDWLQVAQRISRSEEGMARWEVASSSPERLEQAVKDIHAITDTYVEAKLAEYE